MKRSGFLGLVLSLFVFSCTGKEDENKRVFIAGQIINPSSRTVTFYEGNKIVDMFELDEQFRFQKYYDSLSNGIFKLEHLPEYQSLLLEQVIAFGCESMPPHSTNPLSIPERAPLKIIF